MSTMSWISVTPITEEQLVQLKDEIFGTAMYIWVGVDMKLRSPNTVDTQLNKSTTMTAIANSRDMTPEI